MNDYTMDQIRIGMEVSFSKIITLEMENAFRMISGDDNPLHRDDDYATEMNMVKFKSHVTFGMLTASFYSTMAGMYLPGKYSLIHSFDELSFRVPVYVGDVLEVTGKVIDKNEDLNLIILMVVIKNQDNKTVSTAKMKVIVLR